MSCQCGTVAFAELPLSNLQKYRSKSLTFSYISSILNQNPKQTQSWLVVIIRIIVFREQFWDNSKSRLPTLISLIFVTFYSFSKHQPQHSVSVQSNSKKSYFAHNALEADESTPNPARSAFAVLRSVSAVQRCDFTTTSTSWSSSFSSSSGLGHVFSGPRWSNRPSCLALAAAGQGHIHS